MSDLEPHNNNRPAWQRPPFEPQHTKSLKHGMWSRSDRFISVRMAELVNEARDTCDYLNDPSYEAALVDWARTEARIEQGERWLAETGGDLGPNGGIKPAANYLLRLQAHANKVRERLGLDPVARAKITKDLAQARRDDHHVKDIVTVLTEAAEEGDQ
ncbi:MULTISPECIES: hypothetical protein [Rhodococcus]|uniref:hypothetical protein n=1 Tax=Rhodococcus TaxID=1827 RepID=UPI00193B7067|nr:MULTISPECIES: hypothetical protein [Rhodococcus]QRI76257.1 hypothetical protein JQ505_00030 [Rhodococcus aetherivorans]QSE59668.1 hypothetical protein JYA75_01145 [Rhodococcus sp. PSBB066]